MSRASDISFFFARAWSPASRTEDATPSTTGVGHVRRVHVVPSLDHAGPRHQLLDPLRRRRPLQLVALALVHRVRHVHDRDAPELAEPGSTSGIRPPRHGQEHEVGAVDGVARGDARDGADLRRDRGRAIRIARPDHDLVPRGQRGREPAPHPPGADHGDPHRLRLGRRRRTSGRRPPGPWGTPSSVCSHASPASRAPG